MPRRIHWWKFVAMVLLSWGAFVFARGVFVTQTLRQDAPAMAAAERRAAAWFLLVEENKRMLGIDNDVPPGIPFRGMVGSEWSEITTTLGSMEAKRTAAQPVFAALVVRMLHDAGVDSTSTVGVVISGSFPSLAVAALAALQTIGAEAVVISSLGASSYGANQPGATWLDMEEWLRAEGGLRYRSALVTMGAEGDSGGGLPEEGVAVLRSTAARHRRTLPAGMSFDDAVKVKTDLLCDPPVTFLINIGGNQTSLGTCPHAEILPTGLCTHLPRCPHPGRGVIERCAERGIPFLHLLNIQSIAAQYGIPLAPAADRSAGPDGVFMEASVNRSAVLVLVLSLVLLFLTLLRPARRLPPALP